MNSRTARVVTILLTFCCPLAAQHASSMAPKSARFQWDYQKSEELDLKDSFRNNKTLTKEQKSGLIAAISAQYRPAKNDPEPLTPSEIRKIAMNTRIAFNDLNNDGTNEVIAQPAGDNAGCGATGNCPIWIFEPSAKSYRILLDGTAQTFTVQPDSTNGFRDVVLGQHASASEQMLYLYSFRNGRYRKGACYDANWQIMTDDEVKELKKPRITRCNWR